MKRAAILAIMALGPLAAVAPILPPSAAPWPKPLLWNASASVPIGLYLLRPDAPLRAGELVAATPPTPLAHFMAARGYLPASLPLLKHVSALPGHSVCRHGRTITVDGVATAMALRRDSRGRPLPVWQSCRTLRTGEVFLLNPGVKDSFDGRYFGPLPASSVVARAVPLWIPGRRQ